MSLVFLLVASTISPHRGGGIKTHGSVLQNKPPSRTGLGYPPTCQTSKSRGAVSSAPRAVSYQPDWAVHLTSASNATREHTRRTSMRALTQLPTARALRRDRHRPTPRVNLEHLRSELVRCFVLPYRRSHQPAQQGFTYNRQPRQGETRRSLAAA